MDTKKVVEDGIIKMYEMSGGANDYGHSMLDVDIYKDEFRAFSLSLVKAVGEEVIGENETGSFGTYNYGENRIALNAKGRQIYKTRDILRAKQRKRLDEIMKELE